MDGAKPQWVGAEHLANTAALDTWENGDEDIDEQPDPPEVVRVKCDQLVEWLRHAKRPCFMLGAGISASVLPTFRGAGGLWTKSAGSRIPENAPALGGLPIPTLAHRGLVALEKVGKVNWVATQNYDNLSVRSGFPEKKLSELHGNIYTEHCPQCQLVFRRGFEVELPTATHHETGRHCPDCGDELRDNIVHFGEDLPFHQLKMANAKFVGTDLAIVLGSSLQVEPAASLPFRAKRRYRDTSSARPRPKSVVVNLQPTPNDGEADLVIRATCDEVIERLATEFLGADWDAETEVGH